ncbi:hypothetical protein NPIL_31891 [Nephila pilipes]|uniref:Lipase domain-containing protein n=1 Tax=Nephila pilipes TaxID=299642 RepID=A0A8X6QGS8_NEPPI|nr:hypothetical protein NPIL_31891 [Nephila pilipes]
MMLLFTSALILLASTSVSQKIDDEDFIQLLSMSDGLSSYLAVSAEDIGREMLNPPMNRNTSIQYLLFTPNNTRKPCFIEPTIENINKCAFNPKYRTKFLIHGFTTQLKPGNLFEQIKDRLLALSKYNIIIVNWTRYNQSPYMLAASNAYAVGFRVGEMIKFLVENTGINPNTIHLIGHSLGSHISGVAGKQVGNLGRITGSDPAAPLYTMREKINKLDYTDANFVDIIHSSSFNNGNGLGLHEPLGHIDFYPNGGVQQPACKIGKNYTSGDGEIFEIQTPMDIMFCNHDMAVLYFLYSIMDCNNPSIQCDSYKKYKLRQCSSKSRPTSEMGLRAKKIPRLSPKSKFYLNTTAYYPYCSVKRSKTKCVAK